MRRKHSKIGSEDVAYNVLVIRVAGRHSPVPADLALAAAEVLLHLAECHGGGVLVVFVRILGS
jgi:hypothetical protein